MTDNIAQATATVVVTSTPRLIYNGGPQVTATGTATGVGGVNLSSDLTINSTHTNAGSYSDTWSFTDPTGNYAPETGAMTDTIGQATATVMVTPISGLVYNGSPQQTASYSATGVNGALPSTDFTDTTVHTNAGTYNDTWTFTDPNYVSQTGSVTDNIAQATATILVTPTPGLIYNGGPQVTATGTATGVGGVNLNSDLTVNSTHTNAGTYTDSWTFTDPNGNYGPNSGGMTDTIAKANANISVIGYNSLYNAMSHIATGAIYGVNGVNLAGLNLNGTAHTNVADYTDSWFFTDTTGNYNNASGTVVDTIAPATANITVVGYTTTYDGMLHEAAGAAINLNNTVLAGLNLPAHTNSGTYIDTWTFSNPNYNSASGTVIDTITKANANIAVVGYNTFYNAVSHIAIGAVYGVNGGTLSGLNLSNTVHTNVGTYTDVWTFTDTTGNYNNASGTVVDTITPSKSKMVKETVLVPKTTVVKATVLVPGIKEVKIVERVQVNGKWIKKTVLVPETVMVKKTVLVNETKMVHKTEMVKVYYS